MKSFRHFWFARTFLIRVFNLLISPYLYYSHNQVSSTWLFGNKDMWTYFSTKLNKICFFYWYTHCRSGYISVHGFIKKSNRIILKHRYMYMHIYPKYVSNHKRHIICTLSNVLIQKKTLSHTLHIRRLNVHVTKPESIIAYNPALACGGSMHSYVIRSFGPSIIIK